MGKLEGKKIAVLVTDGFEEIELTSPLEALKKEGAKPFIIAPGQKVKSWDMTDWGEEYQADVLLNDAKPQEYDALLLPGGVMNPDKLRMNKKAVELVKHFTDQRKPIASICHGPWTLIETGYCKGKKMTSYPSISSDLINAGANWVNEEVVVDEELVTSRKPDDLSAFNKQMINVFAHETVRA